MEDMRVASIQMALVLLLVVLRNGLIVPRQLDQIVNLKRLLILRQAYSAVEG